MRFSKFSAAKLTAARLPINHNRPFLHAGSLSRFQRHSHTCAGLLDIRDEYAGRISNRNLLGDRQLPDLANISPIVSLKIIRGWHRSAVSACWFKNQQAVFNCILTGSSGI
jgi:hypothetical protein